MPNNFTPPAEVIDIILDRGIVSPTCCIKCPPCGGRYMLSSFETSLQLFETCCCSMLTDCCVNYAFDESRYFQSVEALGNWGITLPYDEIVDGTYYRYSYCDNGFKERVEYLKSIMPPLDFADLIGKGFIEVGSPGGYQSGLGALLDFAQNNFVFSFSSPYEFFGRILDKGLVFWCDQENFITAKTEAYISYATTMGVDISDPGCSGPPVPP